VHKFDYQLPSGDVALIEVDEMGDSIAVSISGQEKGTISLSPNEDLTGFYITHLDLDKCKGQGIGRECLKSHIKVFSAQLAASSPYSCEKLDDGSHLTGDGLPFISKMRDEGIVCRHPDEYGNG